MVYELGWGFHFHHIFKRVKKTFKRVFKRVRKTTGKVAKKAIAVAGGVVGGTINSALQGAESYLQQFQQIPAQPAQPAFYGPVYRMPQNRPVLRQPVYLKNGGSDFKKYLPYIAAGAAALLLLRR